MNETNKDITLLKLEGLQEKIQATVRSLLDINEAIDEAKKTLETSI